MKILSRMTLSVIVFSLLAACSMPLHPATLLAPNATATPHPTATLSPPTAVPTFTLSPKATTTAQYEQLQAYQIPKRLSFRSTWGWLCG